MNLAHLNHYDYQIFKTSCGKHISGPRPPFRINENERQKLSNIREADTGSQYFGFVVDLIQFEITNCRGIERWIGDQSRQMYEYLKIIHPNYVHQQMQMALTSVEMSSGNTDYFELVDQQLVSYLPLKDLNGKYWWVRKESAPLRFDARGRIVAYTNLFSVGKEYNGEFRAPQSDEQQSSETNETYQIFLRAYRKSSFRNMPFTRRQLQIMEVYAGHQKLSDITAAQILNISKRAIDTHIRRILYIARFKFLQNFTSITEVAHFLRNQKIV